MSRGKVASVLFLILSIITPIIILYFISFNVHDNEELLHKKLYDQATLLSWIFTGIIGFVSFVVLFITFTFENKLVVSANTLKRIISPFGINIKELKRAFIDYNSLLRGDRVLKLIYYIFLTIGSFVSVIWGTVIGYFTQFEFPTKIDFSVPSIFVFGIYSFWIILYGVFILVGILIFQIRYNKNPFQKGSLPTIKEITNVDFLDKKGLNFDEFFSINYPTIKFYQNPPKQKETYEINCCLPIALNNYRFVIKFYSNEHVILKCYGILKGIVDYENIGKDYIDNLSSDFNKSVYKQLLTEESYGELQLFNSELKVIARYLLEKRIIRNNYFYYEISRSIEITGKNLDKGLLLNLKKPIEIVSTERSEG